MANGQRKEKKEKNTLIVHLVILKFQNGKIIVTTSKHYGSSKYCKQFAFASSTRLFSHIMLKVDGKEKEPNSLTKITKTSITISRRVN